MSESNRPALRVLSLGAGVQSTTLALMAAESAARGGEDPAGVGGLDCAIFADTGWEPAAVYAHLNRLEPVLTEAGIPVYRVSAGNLRSDTLDPAKHAAAPPLFLRNPDGTDGMTRRACTADYKVAPIKRRVRELLGYPHPTPVPKGVYAEQWVGFSADEVGRVRDSDVAYTRLVFPLLDLKMTRKDCIRWLAARGWGDTPKSACVGCPLHGNRAWRELRDNHPDEWADAVAFDAAIRHGTARANGRGVELRGQAFLHRSRVPLGVAPIDRVTSAEWRDRQGDLLDAIADAEAEEGDPDGCSPYGCRSGAAV